MNIRYPIYEGVYRILTKKRGSNRTKYLKLCIQEKKDTLSSPKDAIL